MTPPRSLGLRAAATSVALSALATSVGLGAWRETPWGGPRIRPCPDGAAVTATAVLDRAECFATRDYDAARAKFRAEAEAAGFRVNALRVDHGGESGDGDDDDLTIDVAVRVGADPSSVLVLTSGVHGVEGYTGSAVQAAALTALRDEKRAAWARPTLVLAHALNPFGMKHMRRANEHNVDLNRNALFDEDEIREVRTRSPNAAGYEDLHAALNPPAASDAPWLAMLVNFALAAARDLRAFSVAGVKRAVVTGTYAHPEGVFYGGRGLEPSHALFAEFLKREGLLSAARRVIVVDVHSGIGPHGEDSIMVSTHRDPVVVDLFTGNDASRATGDDDVARDDALLRRVLNVRPYALEFERDAHDAVGAASGYELVRGHTQSSLPLLFANARGLRIGVTQEFGTVPSAFVLKALVTENAAWHHGTPAQREAAARELFRAFMPDSQRYVERVVERGLAVFFRAVSRLNAPE